MDGAFETDTDCSNLFGKATKRSDAWYRMHFDNIDQRLKGYKPQYSIDIDAAMKAEAKLEEWMESHLDTTFQQDLMDRIRERNMDSVTFYKVAMMDRKLFSSIRNNVQYKPSMETAVACCLALDLSHDETRELLY